MNPPIMLETALAAPRVNSALTTIETPWKAGDLNPGKKGIAIASDSAKTKKRTS